MKVCHSSILAVIIRREVQKKMQEHIIQVDRNCCHAIADLVRLCEFATVERTLQIVLQRYGVSNINELRVGSVVHTLPSIALLQTINNHVELMIDGHLSRKSFITLKTLEDEIVDSLRSSLIPGILSLRHRLGVDVPNDHCSQIVVQEDPNELSLDDPTDNRSYNTSNNNISSSSAKGAMVSFADYGVGLLEDHPKIQHAMMRCGRSVPFSSAVTTKTEKRSWLCDVEVLQNIVLYLSHLDWKGDTRIFDPRGFESFLCTKYDVSHISALGIVVVGNMRADVAALRTAVSYRVAAISEVTKTELRDFYAVSSFASNPDRSASTSKRRRKEENEVDERHCGGEDSTTTSHKRRSKENKRVVSISCSPSRSAVQFFVDFMVKEHEQKSVFHPSFKTVHSYVHKYFCCDKSAAQYARSTGNGNDKRTINKHSTRGDAGGDSMRLVRDNSTDCVSIPQNLYDTLTQVASEYLMLHLGGSRYVEKRLVYEKEQVQEQEEEEQGEEEEEENEEEEDDEKNEKGSEENQEKVMDKAVDAKHIDNSIDHQVDKDGNGNDDDDDSDEDEDEDNNYKEKINQQTEKEELRRATTRKEGETGETYGSTAHTNMPEIMSFSFSPQEVSASHLKSSTVPQSLTKDPFSFPQHMPGRLSTNRDTTSAKAKSNNAARIVVVEAADLQHLLPYLDNPSVTSRMGARAEPCFTQGVVPPIPPPPPPPPPPQLQPAALHTHPSGLPDLPPWPPVVSIPAGPRYPFPPLSNPDTELAVQSGARNSNRSTCQVRPLQPYPLFADIASIGRWGESLVYQLLRTQLSDNHTVQWVNKTEESMAAYDIIIQRHSSATSTSSNIKGSEVPFHERMGTSMDTAAVRNRNGKGMGDVDVRTYTRYLCGGGVENTNIGDTTMGDRAADKTYIDSSSKSSSNNKNNINCLALPDFFTQGHGKAYIEVKTSTFTDRNVFTISPWEWDFATKEPRVPYHVIRVNGAGDGQKVHVVILMDIVKLVEDRHVKLCLAL